MPYRRQTRPKPTVAKRRQLGRKKPLLPPKQIADVQKKRSSSRSASPRGTTVTPQLCDVLGGAKGGGTLRCTFVNGNIYYWIEGYDDDAMDPRNMPGAKSLGPKETYTKEVKLMNSGRYRPTR